MVKAGLGALVGKKGGGKGVVDNDNGIVSDERDYNGIVSDERKNGKYISFKARFQKKCVEFFTKGEGVSKGSIFH